MMKMRAFAAVAFLIAVCLFGCSVIPNNSSALKAEPQGALCLKIRGDFSKIKTQATFNDISTLSVKVQTSDFAVQRHDFSASDLTNDASASISFNSLKTGNATISAEVASGSTQIGRSTAIATILAGQTTQVSLNVQLDPTYIDSGNLLIDLSIAKGDEALIASLPYLVSTLAGKGEIGSVDATGTEASFNGPTGVAVDASGSVYVADTNNNTIRKIAGGVVTLFAGSADGSEGHADGNATTEASFNLPTGVAVDNSGNVYVADSNNNKIRKIAGGVVSTLAGSADGPAGHADGVATTEASFDKPTGVAVDASGNVYVADTNNNTIRKIAGGVVTLFAGSADGSEGHADGDATTEAKFNGPTGVAVDASGNVYVADSNNNTVRKIAGGVVSTLAGSATRDLGSNDGTRTEASFDFPTGVAVDSSGNVYVADYNNNKIRKITSTGVVKTMTGSADPGSVNGTLSVASFSSPFGIAIDDIRRLYVADYGKHMIRKISVP